MSHHDVADELSVPGFRALMAGFPSGVVVVSTVDEAGEPLGLTVSSLCSVSLAPPLLLVCITNHSRTLSALRSRGHFAVNMLHQHGREAAQTFATDVPDRFRSVPWAPSEREKLPLLIDDAHSVAECAVRSAEVAGDHTIVVGEVRSFERLRAEAPLLYGLREYAAWPSADRVDAGRES